MEVKEFDAARAKEGRDEEKKWRIAIIQTAINSRIQMLESDRAQVRSDADRVENFFRNCRNNTITGISFAAPLALGFFQADFFNEFMLQVVFVGLLFGLGASIVLYGIKERIHSRILSIDGSYLSTISKLNHFRSYFNTEIYYLDRMTDKRIAAFSIMVVLLRWQYKWT
jgi:hypothetical protein